MSPLPLQDDGTVIVIHDDGSNDDEEMDYNMDSHHRHNHQHNDEHMLMSSQQLEHLKQDFLMSSETVIENAIKSQITPKINELINRFIHMEQSISMLRAQQEPPVLLPSRVSSPQTRDRNTSVVIHEDSGDDDEQQQDNERQNEDSGSDSDEDPDDIAPLNKMTSNGTMVMHSTPTPPIEERIIAHNYKAQLSHSKTTKKAAISLPLSKTSPSAHLDGESRLEMELEIERERESWNKTVKSLEAEISKLKTENYECKEKIANYELRLNRVTAQSKQFFTLQTKLDYHERLSNLVKDRCFSLHKQLTQDLLQLSQWFNNQQQNTSNKDDHKRMLQNKLLRIQSLFNQYLRENVDDYHENEEIGEIQQLFQTIVQLTEKINKKSYVMWRRMHNSFQYGIHEIFSIHQQLKDLCIVNNEPVSIMVDNNAMNHQNDTRNLVQMMDDVNTRKLRSRTIHTARNVPVRKHRHSHSIHPENFPKKQTKISKHEHSSSSNLVLTAMLDAGDESPPHRRAGSNGTLTPPTPQPQPARPEADENNQGTKPILDDSVAMLKQMNNEILPLNLAKKSMNKTGADRPRTYSHHDLEQLKFVPIPALKDDVNPYLSNNNNSNNSNNSNKPQNGNRLRLKSADSNDSNFSSVSTRSHDHYSTKRKKRSKAKRVSFAPKTDEPMLLRPTTTPLRDKQVFFKKPKDANKKPQPQRNGNASVASTLTRHHRHHSETAITKIREIDSKKKKSNHNVISKLYENDEKLNEDVINKLRAELLQNRTSSKDVTRRHSIVSAKDYVHHIQHKMKENEAYSKIGKVALNKKHQMEQKQTNRDDTNDDNHSHKKSRHVASISFHHSDFTDGGDPDFGDLLLELNNEHKNNNNNNAFPFHSSNASRSVPRSRATSDGSKRKKKHKHTATMTLLSKRKSPAPPLSGLAGDRELGDHEVDAIRNVHLRTQHHRIRSSTHVPAQHNRLRIRPLSARGQRGHSRMMSIAVPKSRGGGVNGSKHKRYKTASFNPTLLSPGWAAAVALKNMMSGGGHSRQSSRGVDDDGFSDAVSTLSNVDYTYMLDLDEDFAEDDENESYEHYVDINYQFGQYDDMDAQYEYGLYDDDDGERKEEEDEEEEEEHIPLHARSRSYRFPTAKTRYSVVDPFDLLDDKVLQDLTTYNEHQQQFNQSEVKMKAKLLEVLREMDLMGEGRLDIADFASGIMNIVNDYDDIMEDAELLFETLGNLQDDMGSLKIEDIVDAIMLNKDDGAATNIKQQIMMGMNPDGNDADANEEADDDEEDEDGDGEDGRQANGAEKPGDFENMPALHVKPKEHDPNEEPYKPIYYFTKGLQQFAAKQPKSSDNTEDDTSDNAD